MSAIALAVGICTSCQKEREPSPTPGASGDQVTVIATISDAGTKVSYSEEGTNLNQSWSVGDCIVGWDAAGHAIELEIADEDKITDGTAIFTPVTGSAAVPSSGKVYMIYAPGKHYTDVGDKSLTYDLDSQDENSVPALMTATGSVSNNVLALNFTNRLAIVAVKNPTFPVTAATPITGLQLSGGNILTKATFSLNSDGELQMNSSELGAITKDCDFTTATNGTSEATVYFAVLPNGMAADVTVSTTAPTGYQISFPSKSFTAGKCYMLNQKDINKQTFTVTVADNITNGTITTYPTSGSSVAWGETVTVTATPDTGYGLYAITVKYADGVSVPVSADGKFTMPAKNVTVTATFEALTGTINDHNYVKIGGKKWATMNIGASSATEAGRYFEWGDVTGLTWSGSWSGHGGFWNPAPDIGNPTTLPLEHDAANTNWGSNWRMPTKDDFVALAANGVWYRTADYNSTGVSGYIVYVAKNDDDKGKLNMGTIWKKWNGSSFDTDASAATEIYDVTDPHIFFPAAGAGWSSNLEDVGVYGAYWSSTLYSGDTDYAYYFRLNNIEVFPQDYNSRYLGYSVRPLSD